MEKKRAGNVAVCAVLALLLTALALSGTACGCNPYKDAPEFRREIIADFADGESEAFSATDGYGNGGVFNVEWDTSMVTYADGTANLTIAEKPDGEGNDPAYTHYGGEMRSDLMYHYGFYSAVMKPSDVTGTCTSFFVYTGEYDYDEEGNPHPWDEIDIEFLGKDTTFVQFNYFVNGVGGHEYEYDLGFDASEEFHEYGFYWEKERITWYVDGEPVYRVEASDKNPLPSHSGRIMMNHWYGNTEAELWMEKYTADESTSYYKSVSCTAEGKEPNPAPQPPATEGNYDPTVFEDAETTSLTFFTEVPDVYTLNPAETATDTVNVTYTAKGSSYNNVAADISVNDKNAFSVKITNNADTETNVRINMIAVTAPSATNASCNVYATYEGKSVRTDSEWGGSFFTVPAKSSGYVNIWYASSIKQVQFMIDSHHGDEMMRSGDVTFSEFKFAMDDGVEFDDTVPEVPETPTYDPSVFDGVEPIAINFDKVADGYTVVQNEGKTDMNVTYSAVTGNSYINIASDLNLTDKNAFSVKIKNNSADTEAKVRINIEYYGTSNSHCNEYAMWNGEEVSTDKTNGGSAFTIPAGGEGTAIVWFTSPMTQVQFMIDSFTYDDSSTHSGNLTFSEFKLVMDDSVASEKPETPELTVPGDQTAPSDSDGIALGTISQWGGYTVTPSNDGTSFRITYAGLSQQWAGFGCDLTSEMVGTATTLSMKVKNDGTAASSFKVDVGTKPAEEDLENKVTAASYTDADGSHDVTLGSYMVTVPAGETVTLTVTFTNDNISGMNIFADSLESDYASKVGNLVFGEFTFA